MGRAFEGETGLEAIEDALVWLEARLLADPDAADLAPSVSAVLARVGAVREAEREAGRDVLRAEARVDAADASLDDHVNALADALRSVISDPDGTRFHRYFQRGAEHVVRLGLASQLEVVRSWPALLAEDEDGLISAGSGPIAEAIRAGDAAIEARRTAAVRQAEVRVGRVLPLVEDVNAVLAAISDDLDARGRDRPGWAERFRL